VSTPERVIILDAELERDLEADISIIHTRRISWNRRQRFYLRVVKSALDRVVAVVAIILTLPLMAAAAIAVRLSLGSGVFFSQDRVGLDGEVFTCRKFRTMKHSRRKRQVPIAHPCRRVSHKSFNDPRLTATGRFLRKWSLDELPQLFNVLAGDMSIVGPRPELPEIVAAYPDPAYTLRHQVKPGLTGPWQISERGSRPMHECVDIDLEYVERVSLWLDVQIIAKTPIAAFGEHQGH
jgi:lipopolysaccharide/colanic/teichoic acid biosynthesis glycosyltransferase